MPVSTILDQTRDAMAKAVEHTAHSITKVRTGRASASLMDNLKIDYYGSPTPLPQVGSVSTPDARTILIQPWDRTTINAIEKAIHQSDLGLNPSNDGTVIRIPVPPLTEERRKEYVKMCKKMAEEGKVAVRNIRRDYIEKLKAAEKTEHFSEDETKRGEAEIQKITDKYITEIDAVLSKKEKEIMED
ncbi:MAG TPA: ribosome recycling factor [Candidatus Kapabacteria bacterium]|nr:ribosome recycling factor [Candidatus Kapabacteria bacterium]HRK59202.1 ribosome recycling factor [Candidatus Kapabacteria bacterium]